MLASSHAPRALDRELVKMNAQAKDKASGVTFDEICHEVAVTCTQLFIANPRDLVPELSAECRLQPRAGLN